MLSLTDFEKRGYRTYTSDEAEFLLATAREAVNSMDLSDEDRASDLESISHVSVLYKSRPDSRSSSDLLRHLAFHCGNHRAYVIRETYYQIDLQTGTPTPENLTAAHFDCYRKMEKAYDNGKFRIENSTQEVDDYFAVCDYALSHIEDATLIIYLVCERGINTVEMLLEALPKFKENGSLPLISGIL